LQQLIHAAKEKQITVRTPGFSAHEDFPSISARSQSRTAKRATIRPPKRINSAHAVREN
jgi:hypothetical protein